MDITIEEVYETIILPAMKIEGIKDTPFNRYDYLQKVRQLEDNRGRFVVSDPQTRTALALETFRLFSIICTK
jgi:hypothetical protein